MIIAWAGSVQERRQVLADDAVHDGVLRGTRTVELDGSAGCLILATTGMRFSMISRSTALRFPTEGKLLE